MNRYPRTSRRRFRRSTPDRSGTPGRNGEAHGQREIRADEAALQHRDDWPRGPRQDDADGGDHQGIGGTGQGAADGGRTRRQSARGGGRGGGEGGQEPGGGQELDRGADERGGQLHRAAGACEGPAVPDAGGGRVLDFGSRHGGDGSDRARGDQGRGGSGDRGAQSHAEDHGDRGEDVPQAARPRRGGGQRVLTAAGV